LIISRIGVVVVVENTVIVIVLPVYSVGLDILNLIVREIEALRTILDHPKKIHVSRTPLALTVDA
jgi:hypothetical protein